MLRPDVVLFGEGLPQGELRHARKAVEQCDIFLSVGAVGAIEPIASFPFIAKRGGALLVAVDDQDSIYSVMSDYTVATRPGETLPDLVNLITGAASEKQVA